MPKKALNASVKPDLRIDNVGKVRFAHLTAHGKTSKLRIPLLIWALDEQDPRRAALVEHYLFKLEARFFREHGVKPRG